MYHVTVLPQSVRTLKCIQVKTGFVRVLKTFEFQKSDFKALKVLEIDFWFLKVLDFLLKKMGKY